MTLISFSCCTPEEDPLAACKADPNCEYFECLVDGEKWVPSCESGPIFGCSAIDIQFYKDLNYLVAIGKNENESIVIYVHDIVNLKQKYKLFKSNSATTLFSEKSLNICDNFEIDTTLNNFFYINEIDTSKFIITAEFEFQAKDTCNNLKSIKNGSLRTKYRF